MVEVGEIDLFYAVNLEKNPRDVELKHRFF